MSSWAELLSTLFLIFLCDSPRVHWSVCPPASLWSFHCHLYECEGSWATWHDFSEAFILGPWRAERRLLCLQGVWCFVPLNSSGWLHILLFLLQLPLTAPLTARLLTLLTHFLLLLLLSEAKPCCRRTREAAVHVLLLEVWLTKSLSVYRALQMSIQRSCT